jgi:hypothetical protein
VKILAETFKTCVISVMMFNATILNNIGQFDVKSNMMLAIKTKTQGSVVVMIVWLLDLQLLVQSVPISTRCEFESCHARCTQYSASPLILTILLSEMNKLPIKMIQFSKQDFDQIPVAKKMIYNYLYNLCLSPQGVSSNPAMRDVLNTTLCNKVCQ